jgi:hypothetical protein
LKEMQKEWCGYGICGRSKPKMLTGRSTTGTEGHKKLHQKRSDFGWANEHFVPWVPRRCAPPRLVFELEWLGDVQRQLDHLVYSVMPASRRRFHPVLLLPPHHSEAYRPVLFALALAAQVRLHSLASGTSPSVSSSSPLSCVSSGWLLLRNCRASFWWSSLFELSLLEGSLWLCVIRIPSLLSCASSPISGVGPLIYSCSLSSSISLAIDPLQSLSVALVVS